MSLFENDEYQWRETYFVLFDAQKRPAAHEFEAMLKGLNPSYEIRDVRGDDAGKTGVQTPRVHFVLQSNTANVPAPNGTTPGNSAGAVT